MIPLLLVVGCSDTSDLEARLARLEAENASLKEVTQTSTPATTSSTPVAVTQTSTPTVTQAAQQKATAAATQRTWNIYSSGTTRYISTGGSNVFPRSECKQSTWQARAVISTVPHGTTVKVLDNYSIACKDWLLVRAPAISNFSFYVLPEYTSVVRPTAAPTPTARPTVEPTATPTARPTAAPTVSAGGGSYGSSVSLYALDGTSYLVADDGTFLGDISSNSYASDSICNSYGSYGSKYETDSIRNEYGTYGNEYSSKSPYNEYTSTPPKIIQSGRVVGYLTKNKYLSGAIDPDELLIALDCLR